MHRIGHGTDTHRLEPGRRLVLGGVEIAHEKGAVAHSDGDVLLHALTDALLGATGLGDIGEWFPDDDPQFQGADSAMLLKRVRDDLRRRGWKVVNVDCTLHAQRPKLSQYKSTIAARVAELLGLPVDAVGLKAKTGEGVGPIGREEAIAADVVVLLERVETGGEPAL